MQQLPSAAVPSFGPHESMRFIEMPVLTAEPIDLKLFPPMLLPPTEVCAHASVGLLMEQHSIISYAGLSSNT